MRSGLSPRLAAIAGSAVLTMVVSSVCMKRPMATSQRVMFSVFLWSTVGVQGAGGVIG